MRRNNIYFGLDGILKQEEKRPEHFRTVTSERIDSIKKRNYLPAASKELQYEFSVGEGKWHTGYLTFGIKFKD